METPPPLVACCARESVVAVELSFAGAAAEPLSPPGLKMAASFEPGGMCKSSAVHENTFYYRFNDLGNLNKCREKEQSNVQTHFCY
uniref:Uncharacterized protein n=1 Tax=Arundo donax TaxID=35708 RepID=A0A0A9D8W9_ARUDO